MHGLKTVGSVKNGKLAKWLLWPTKVLYVGHSPSSPPPINYGMEIVVCFNVKFSVLVSVFIIYQKKNISKTEAGAHDRQKCKLSASRNVVDM